MRSTNRRVEQAARARDERLALAWLGASPPPTCSGCGRPLPTELPGIERRGRTRIWCSDACRQKAYRVRKAATRDPATAASPPVEHESVTAHTEDDCVVAVLNAPTAVAAVLDVVRRAVHDGNLDSTEYADVQVALIALAEELRG